MKFRWIMYVAQDFPGNPYSDLSRHTSLRDAVEAFEQYCEDVYNDNCSAQLYAYSEEDWKVAEEFEFIGCPFDYPYRVIKRGPKGGVRVESI